MRFYRHGTPRPAHLESRVVQYFAIFPVTIEKETRWLEWVMIRQDYIRRTYAHHSADIWKNQAFL